MFKFKPIATFQAQVTVQVPGQAKPGIFTATFAAKSEAEIQDMLSNGDEAFARAVLTGWGACEQTP